MKYRLVTIIFSILFFNILYAQNGDVANKGAGLVDTTKKVSDGSDIFARIEIRKMDSMLNLLCKTSFPKRILFYPNIRTTQPHTTTTTR